ncbi:MAG TPA: GNAT family N-acetyltransferase [Pyrinomonadaceae bacterium]|jgi:RimJ/RimL family protein N-acetyltransferase
MLVRPVTLEGRFVRLEPLSLSHLAELCEAAFDEELWRYTNSVIKTEGDLREYIETALRWQEEGSALPFATIDKTSGRAVGSTRFGAIDTANRHMEIGWTWIAREYQRTYVNTEAKYLMLGHAFEDLSCLRVEFKTDSLNEKSRRALSRIGALEEGTFRNHMIMPGGRIRHSVYFSIIDTEWPEVKAALEEKLGSGRK